MGNNLAKYYAGLVFVWFIVCSALIFWLGTANKSSFDSDMRLSQAIMDLDFESDFIALVSQGSSQVNSKTVINFVQEDCYCEFLAREHTQNIEQLALSLGFKHLTLNINNYPALKAYVPSTPAVAVVSGDQKMVYLGPYSRGVGCFSNTGEINSVLEKYNAEAIKASIQEKPSQILPSTIIDTDAMGCYCST